MNTMLYNELSFPSGAEYLLHRPALHMLIKSSLSKPLTTVVAGAGYGKTQAVLTTLESAEYNAAWIQLSELDNHINRFWERIAYAVKTFSTTLSDSLETMGYPESIVAFDHFLHLLARELPLEKRFVFVFDDFHFINNATVLNFFELFISARIQNISILIISRNEPNLSLAGMMSKGLLSRINEDDLRFSKEETEHYFNLINIKYDKSIVEKVHAYTDGWIFALYLVGLSARKANINAQKSMLAAKIDIMNLIEKEIFSAASKPLQDFFIKHSDFDFIPSGLFREFANNNFSLISEMMQLSLFIRYDAFSDGYRIHHIFKEFLIEKRHLRPAEDTSEIHLAAANWYKNAGRKAEALIHYEKCGQYDEIFDIILSFTHHVAKETADLFISLIEKAPADAIKAKPIMRIVRANFIFNNNRIDEAKQELCIIRNEYEAMPETKETRAILGEVYIALGLISVVYQDYEYVELFKKAYHLLPEGSVLVNEKMNIAEGLNLCSIKIPTAGELKKHQDALFEVAPYASKVMHGCGYGTENLNAAESSLYLGDLKAAEKYAYEAIYKSNKFLQYDIEYMANFVLLRISTAKGNYARVMDILKQLQNKLETHEISDCISFNDVIKGWFFVKIGKTDDVPKWIKYEEETRKMLAPVILGREYLVRSDCLLAEERYYELLAFMNQTDQIYQSRGILYAIIQNKITRAIIYHYLDDPEKSIKMLNEAYELTSPNELIMQYIEYGNKMRTLIHNAKSDKQCNIPREWLDKIYTKSSTYAKQLTQVISAYNNVHTPGGINPVKLSKRESEVLELLCQGLNREEIALNCYLSLSTVNTILKKIYNKLGAYNVADAVRIAKENHFF